MTSLCSYGSHRSLVSLLAALSLLPVACSSSSSDPSGAVGTDAGHAGVSEDAGTSGAAEDAGPPPIASDAAIATADAAAPTTWLRFANLSPDSPGLDFCVERGGKVPWIGPLLGAAAGVVYGHLSAYVPLPSDHYDVRMVGAGATDCDTPIGNSEEVLSTLQGGQHNTFMVSGDMQVAGADSPLRVSAYTDDDQPASEVGLRFINASSSLALVDFGEGSLATSSFSPLFTSTRSASVGTRNTVDAGALDFNDYVTVPPMQATVLSAHLTGASTSTDAVVSTPVTAGGGALLTVFLIGGKTGDAAHPSELLVCNDGAGGSAGCSVSP